MALAGKCTQRIAGAQNLAIVGMEMKKHPHDHVTLDLLLHSHNPHGGFLLWKVNRFIVQLPATNNINTPTFFSNVNYVIKTK